MLDESVNKMRAAMQTLGMEEVVGKLHEQLDAHTEVNDPKTGEMVERPVGELPFVQMMMLGASEYSQRLIEQINASALVAALLVTGSVGQLVSPPDFTIPCRGDDAAPTTNDDNVTIEYMLALNAGLLKQITGEVDSTACEATIHKYSFLFFSMLSMGGFCQSIGVSVGAMYYLNLDVYDARLFAKLLAAPNVGFKALRGLIIGLAGLALSVISALAFDADNALELAGVKVVFVVVFLVFLWAGTNQNGPWREESYKGRSLEGGKGSHAVINDEVEPFARQVMDEYDRRALIDESAIAGLDTEDEGSDLVRIMSSDPVATWSTSDVCNWLHQVGFGSVTPQFEDEEINGETLLQITEGHLEANLGVPTLGKRLELLKKMQGLVGA